MGSHRHSTEEDPTAWEGSAIPGKGAVGYVIATEGVHIGKFDSDLYIGWRNRLFL